MKTPFVEQDCSFTFEGRTFESGGAFVSDSHIVAYPGAGGILSDWHGNPIGGWRIVGKQRLTRWSPIGGYYLYAIRMIVSGERVYSGKGFGEGMLCRGKRIKGSYW